MKNRGGQISHSHTHETPPPTDSPTNSQPGARQPRCCRLCSLPVHQSREAARQECEAMDHDGCQVPMHCCRNLIKRVFMGANRNPSPPQSRRRAACRVIKPALWRDQKKKMQLKSSSGASALLVETMGSVCLFFSPLAEKWSERTLQNVTFVFCAYRCEEAEEGRQEARAHPNGLMRLPPPPPPPGRKGRRGVRCPISTQFLFKMSCRLAVGSPQSLEKTSGNMTFSDSMFYFFLAPDKMNF